ncbi:MAG: MOSC N-terminal beta barrel domain-containing protein [Rubrobacteraceae bacterium]
MVRVMPDLTLSGLYVYPIKSAGGIALREARLDSRGIEYDRRWMLVDESRKFMSQRRHPRLALVSTRLTEEHLIVEAPEMPRLRLPLKPEDKPGLDARVWTDVVRAVPVEDAADEWFSSFLGARCTLVYMPDDEVRQVDLEYAEPGDRVGFADGFPFLMISQASLEDLGGRLERAVPVERFRPNLVVEGSDAFAEDGWRALRVGETEFRVVKPCSRCSIVMTDQSSGDRDKEVLATLAGYRRFGKKIFFGQNLAHDSPGTLRVGDPVEVTR